ncbi:hypothetical protein ACFZ8E_15340 [Methylobacterium sp. HMF5984]|uniref:hypothetical protein n=1 Tax=Methylobacterium sp. HMF5984 TaxID=3367370 RepID=UPI0038541E18
MENAHFVGEGPLTFDENSEAKITTLINRRLNFTDADHAVKACQLVKLYISKAMLSNFLTGIVIAGFGSGEPFPTLVSFEIDGMACGRLKYIRTNSIDIDRAGKRAAVVPFAQKEMVERFLYGLDGSIQLDISEFCEKSVTTISQSMIQQLVIEDPEQRAALEAEAAQAEKAFVAGLTEKAFRGIRSQSQSAIEDMVEFMPKPELAKMAEALVNLTSIKRRVSRGFETVGGPIDVAVISQSEGFIWVKRKHYFEAGLNVRYAQRTQSSNCGPRE